MRPLVVPMESYQSYLAEIDASRIYSNNGPLNRRFEERILQEYFGNEGAVATVNNATTGLILSIAQLKRPGKYALMPSFTFAATPLSAVWCGLEPYFIDIKPTDWCMDEELLEEALQTLGDDVAVVVPYATFGTELNLAYYESLIRRNIPVIVDAASSFGSIKEKHHLQGFGGAVVYSFHATKSFGIGEGGLVYSGAANLIRNLRQSSNFGFNEERESMQLGLNGKMSEYSAAIGLATLDVFHEKIANRERIGNWYMKALGKHKLPESGWRVQATAGTVNYQFFPILCPQSQKTEHYINKLLTSGIQARTYFSPPCHRQKMFQHYPATRLTVTEDISQRILSLPVWEDIKHHQIQRIVKCLANE